MLMLLSGFVGSGSRLFLFGFERIRGRPLVGFKRNPFKLCSRDTQGQI